MKIANGLLYAIIIILLTTPYSYASTWPVINIQKAFCKSYIQKEPPNEWDDVVVQIKQVLPEPEENDEEFTIVVTIDGEEKHHEVTTDVSDKYLFGVQPTGKHNIKISTTNSKGETYEYTYDIICTQGVLGRIKGEIDKMTTGILLAILLVISLSKIKKNKIV